MAIQDQATLARPGNRPPESSIDGCIVSRPDFGDGKVIQSIGS